MQHVERITEIYNRLSGVDPDKSPDQQDYYVGDRLKALLRAQEIEPTNALFLMLLEEQVEGLLAKASVTAAAYLKDPSAFDRIIADAREIRALLDDPGVREEQSYLRETMMSALRHYGAAERDDVKELVEAPYAVAHLWRDALNTMIPDERGRSTLEVHQFRQGEPETTKPRYVRDVLGFWTINDALRLALTMPSGIAMCMIRDNEAIHSYFAFLIRNGGTITVVTDRSRYAHPLARQRSRRPDRELDRRMARSWFPYELLKIQYLTDEDGEVVGLNVPRQEGIIPQQQRAFRVKPISAIGAAEIAWTAFMFALLTKRFFVEDQKTETVSYTGEMVEVPLALEAAAYAAGLPDLVRPTVPLAAPHLTSAALNTATIAEAASTRKPVGHNAWMEVRYGAQVPDEVLNSVAAPSLEVKHLFEDGTISSVREMPNTPSWDRGPPKNAAGAVSLGKIHDLDASTFGSAQEVLADRAWLARHNQAEFIERLAKREFKARRAEIEAWWEGVIKARTPELLKAAFAGTFVRSTQGPGSNGFEVGKPAGGRGQEEILSVGLWDPRGRSVYDPQDALTVGEPITREGKHSTLRTGKFRCVVTDRPATHFATFAPQTAEDLAAIAGIRVDELPDVLQHWALREPYTGNSILDRLDPLDDIDNPWRKLTFRTSFHLSSFAFPEDSPFHRSKMKIKTPEQAD
jgi:hypothetical protein